MKRLTYLVGSLTACTALTGAVMYVTFAREHQATDVDAVMGGTLPAGYRDWRVISVAHEEGNHNDLRAVLGNDVAIRAFRERIVPLPDGTAIARLAWRHVPSERNNRAFGRAQSFVAGEPTNVQFMVKDSVKYASTGGWGFAQFEAGVAAAPGALKACFSCHDAFRGEELVFTQYAP